MNANFKPLGLAAAVCLAVSAYADEVIIRDGASCDIPHGSNIAPFDPLWNPNGMSEFCVFPFIPFKEAILDQLDNCVGPDYTPPDLPECNDGLVVSPALPVRPCYEVIYD